MLIKSGPRLSALGFQNLLSVATLLTHSRCGCVACLQVIARESIFKGECFPRPPTSSTYVFEIMLKAAKLPPGPKSPLERALGFVKSTSAVDTLSTLTRNVAQVLLFSCLRMTDFMIRASSSVHDP